MVMNMIVCTVYVFCSCYSQHILCHDHHCLLKGTGMLGENTLSGLFYSLYNVFFYWKFTDTAISPQPSFRCTYANFSEIQIMRNAGLEQIRIVGRDVTVSSAKSPMFYFSFGSSKTVGNANSRCHVTLLRALLCCQMRQ